MQPLDMSKGDISTVTRSPRAGQTRLNRNLRDR
jgi:hypothetical protein